MVAAWGDDLTRRQAVPPVVVTFEQGSVLRRYPPEPPELAQSLLCLRFPIT